MAIDDRGDSGLHGLLTGPRLQQGMLLVFALMITILFLVMVRGFLIALMLAAVFAAIARPAFLALAERLKGRRRIASLCVVVALLILIVGPVGAFLGLVVAQAVEMTQLAGPWVRDQLAQFSDLSAAIEQIPLVGPLLPDTAAIASRTDELVSRAALFLINNVASLTAGTVSFVLQLFVMLYATYFFLIDGPATLSRILDHVPLDAGHERKLVDRFVSVTRATIKGSILVGLIQGALAGAAFVVLGLPAPAFWTTVMAVLSVIPVLGSGIVWGPAAVILMFTGRLGAGIALAVWGIIIVSTADNFLRPRFVGRDTAMPDLLVLLSTFGGLTMFGLVGFIIGPIVAALWLTAWDLHGALFEEPRPGLP